MNEENELPRNADPFVQTSFHNSDNNAETHNNSPAATNGELRNDPVTAGENRSQPVRTGDNRSQPEHTDASNTSVSHANGDLRVTPLTSGENRQEPVATGDRRKRPVITVDPDDDDYVFDSVAGSVYAANRGIRIRARRLRGACVKEDPTLLKCVWKRVGSTKPQWFVGAASLDGYVTRAIRDRELAAHGDQVQATATTVATPNKQEEVVEEPQNNEEQKKVRSEVVSLMAELKKLQSDYNEAEINSRSKSALLKDAAKRQIATERAARKLTRYTGRLEGRLLELGQTNEEIFKLEELTMNEDDDQQTIEEVIQNEIGSDGSTKVENQNAS